MAPWTKVPASRSNRWTLQNFVEEATPASSNSLDVSMREGFETSREPQCVAIASEDVCANGPRFYNGQSFIMKHYHSTGCAGGAFSWRASKLDPHQDSYMCVEPREYRDTTMEDIKLSLDDRRRGGGPRVGPFQESIPGNGWRALPKYDMTTSKRSCAYNERMHVEWENHVDHILANGGTLPTASVVAKAGFRSCAPCCRDMLALARPTGKTFIMVDLAEDDTRGTFHFVCGDRYLPVPKEGCDLETVKALKKVTSMAQDNCYASSEEIYDAVVQVRAPIDAMAQDMYLKDQALLPPGCANHLRGVPLLEVLHAEHFARLLAEYGASIMRDASRPDDERRAVRRCRALAKERLVKAWASHVRGINLGLYAEAAVTPLLPEEVAAYANSSLRPNRALALPIPEAPMAAAGRKAQRWKRGLRLHMKTGPTSDAIGLTRATKDQNGSNDTSDTLSLADQSTAMPDDATSVWSDADGPEYV